MFRCDWEGIVVKADGLAGGKGVVVADDKVAAKAAAEQFLAVSPTGTCRQCGLHEVAGKRSSQ